MRSSRPRAPSAGVGPRRRACRRRVERRCRRPAAGAGIRGRAPLPVRARRRLVRHGRPRHARRARRRDGAVDRLRARPAAGRDDGRLAAPERRLGPGLRRLRLRGDVRPLAALSRLHHAAGVQGEAARSGAYQFTAPTVPGYGSPGVTPSSGPDILTDVRIGVDVAHPRRCQGPVPSRRRRAALSCRARTRIRPSTSRDGTVRAMVRVLFAGDVGALTYAGQLGVHVRPRDDSPTPGSPQGSELLFGAAAGAKVAIFGRAVDRARRRARSLRRVGLSVASSARTRPAWRGSSRRVSREPRTTGHRSGSSSARAAASTLASARRNGGSCSGSSSSTTTRIATGTGSATARMRARTRPGSRPKIGRPTGVPRSRTTRARGPGSKPLQPTRQRAARRSTPGGAAGAWRGSWAPVRATSRRNGRARA